MSDLFNAQSGPKDMQKRVCHVAYTLNNHQPVISTIIGDQPLFYMDYESDLDDMDDDDSIFQHETLRHIEKEMGSIRESMSSLDSFQQSFAQDAEDYYNQFLQVKNDLTEKNNAVISTPDVLEAISQSRLASSLLGFARMNSTHVLFSNQTQTAEYNHRSNTIIVSNNLDFDDQILLTVRELRRVWQIKHTGITNILSFTPDDAVFLNRVQNADLTIAMIRAAWELQLTGLRSPWVRVENSSMADLGRAFAREAFLDFRTIHNGAACTAVFESWFLSERCRAEDKKIIQSMLADYKGYTASLDMIYETVSPALISKFGEMPFGKNYLEKYAVEIVEDPLFTDIRDRSNANFLWFIKFERTFKETEQELQRGGHLFMDDDRSSGYQQKNVQDTSNDGMPADIIAFNSYERDTSQQQSSSSVRSDDGRKHGKDKQPSTGEVIYLRRWSQEP